MFCLMRLSTTWLGVGLDLYALGPTLCICQHVDTYTQLVKWCIQGLIFLPAMAGGSGTVCPHRTAIRNNQRMKLVKYFHNLFLLIFFFFFCKTFPRHFQI